MKILSWNVNGLRAWVDKTGTLEFINRNDLDIVCLIETRMNENIISNFNSAFGQYPFRYWACSVKKGYAGVAVLSKHQPISAKIGFSEQYDHEGRVVTLEFENFILVSSYFPNSGGADEKLLEKYAWDESFREYLQEIMGKNKEIVFIGDLNIVGSEYDYHVPKKKKIVISKTELSSFQKFINLGLVDTFRYLNPTLRKYTWFNNRFVSHRLNNIGWRIDHAFVTKNAVPWVENSLIHDNVLGSDHSPIELILNIP